MEEKKQMSLEEYKRMRLEEVEYFFRGINFKNNGKDKTVYDENGIRVGKKNLKLVDSIEINGNKYDAGIINRDKKYRELLVAAINKISIMYSNLRDNLMSDNKNFFLDGKATVDEMVKNFIDGVMVVLNELKNAILGKLQNDEEIRPNDSYVSSDLDFFKISLGNDNDVFDWIKERNSPQADARVVKENDVVVDSFSSILFHIYCLPLGIKKTAELKSKLLNTLSSILNSDFIKAKVKLGREISFCYGYVNKAKSVDDALNKFNKLVSFFGGILIKMSGIALEKLDDDKRKGIVDVNLVDYGLTKDDFVDCFNLFCSLNQVVAKNSDDTLGQNAGRRRR